MHATPYTWRVTWRVPLTCQGIRSILESHAERKNTPQRDQLFIESARSMDNSWTGMWASRGDRGQGHIRLLFLQPHFPEFGRYSKTPTTTCRMYPDTAIGTRHKDHSCWSWTNIFPRRVEGGSRGHLNQLVKRDLLYFRWKKTYLISLLNFLRICPSFINTSMNYQSI